MCRTGRGSPLVLAGALALAGCGVLEPSDGGPKRLRDARTRWATVGFTSYEYRHTLSCFCPPELTRPYLIRIEDGLAVEVSDVQSGAPPPAGFEARTVADLFDLIEDAYEREAAIVGIDYDLELGYPRRIVIDYDRRIADEELDIRAEGLRELDRGSP